MGTVVKASLSCKNAWPAADLNYSHIGWLGEVLRC